MATEKRLIDVNAEIRKMRQALKKRRCRKNSVANIAFEAIIAVLEKAPTVDAVEVVRCKDCAKAVRHEIFPHSRRCKVEDCRFSHKETHFCSYGERRIE